MHRATLLVFGSAVLSVCGLIWGAEWVFPKSAASAIALVTIVVVGLWIVRPGWNLRPGRFQRYWLVLFSLILASAVAAAWFLTFFKIPLPYDFSTLDIAASVPAILLITGIEELLFRQLMYRWLEQRKATARSTVVATALAFGCAHLGPIFIGSPIGATFYLLQSTYMLWIGILLGETRRATGSWLMPWLGHFGYNIAVLYFLSIV
ncbi:MAG: CPBP family glutamic-type intramembrane protease [Gammaproteobacteria bacterium]|nr:CPBP family glutamic-type intramembrane protease [Gammaproteobacteria bacterium]